MLSPFVIYVYIAVIAILTITAVTFIIAKGLKSRPKSSPNVVLRNINRTSFLDSVIPNEALSDHDKEVVLGLISNMQDNTKSLSRAVHRTVYLVPVTVGVAIACFAPNSPGTRAIVILVTVVSALLLIVAGVRPILRLTRLNKRVRAEFEAWTELHPEFSEKHKRNVFRDNSGQKSWQE